MAKASLSSKASVLALLQKRGDKGIKVTALIKKCGERSPARIFDLRADGFKISTEPSRGPKCTYTLLGKRRAAKVAAKKPRVVKKAKRGRPRKNKK